MAGKYKVYHAVPNPSARGGWRVEGENAKRASSWHDTKEQAIDRGRELAHTRKGQLKVHKGDGQFHLEYTYGKDPFPPKG